VSGDGKRIRELIQIDRMLTKEQKAALERAAALVDAEDLRRLDDTKEVPITPERPR